MPSGKTHDVITVLLAAPTFVAAWGATRSVPLAATGGMLLGVLMFGHDLDILSLQYTRWGLFCFVWWPYASSFATAHVGRTLLHHAKEYPKVSPHLSSVQR